jgi:hypothetical protein
VPVRQNLPMQMRNECWLWSWRQKSMLLNKKLFPTSPSFFLSTTVFRGRDISSHQSTHD